MKPIQILLVAVLQLTAIVSFAQQAPPLELPVLFVSPQEFVGKEHLEMFYQFGSAREGSASRIYYANLNLPEGSRVVWAEVEYCHYPEKVTPPDTTYMTVQVHTGSIENNTIGITGAPAPCGRWGRAIWSYAPVDTKRGLPQFAELYFGHDTGIELFGGLRIFYQLGVPEPPSIATFTDVPTGHPFFRFVEAVHNTGAIAGCGNGRYCPDAPVTRGQLAVFLAAIFGLGF